MGNLIDIKTHAGRSLQIGDLHIVPLVKKTRLQPPNYRGVFIWQKPEAVVIQTLDGTQEVLPIRDYTRWAQMLLMGIGFLGSLLIWLSLRSNQN